MVSSLWFIGLIATAWAILSFISEPLTARIANFSAYTLLENGYYAMAALIVLNFLDWLTTVYLVKISPKGINAELNPFARFWMRRFPRLEPLIKLGLISAILSTLCVYTTPSQRFSMLFFFMLIVANNSLWLVILTKGKAVRMSAKAPSESPTSKSRGQ